MEMASGKLFIGGISWNTTEERLRDYFQTFGEVLESVIMKDRTTGRARGFGFVVFADASVAEQVERERHVIDGRAVEAKKAVPRDDHPNANRNNICNIPVCPSPIRTKKIFVGGLASTITEADFKKYFDQFGTISDVVVMYDHITQRPRGFGFITYDSYEAVDNVLVNTFHSLGGKMVEVKRAVPRESSPGPTRIQPGGCNYSLNRLSSYLTALNQSCNSNSAGGYGIRVNDHFSPYKPFRYCMGLNLDSGFSFNNELMGNSGLGYENGINSHFRDNSYRYTGSMSYDSHSFSNAAKLKDGSYTYAANSGASNVYGHSGGGNTRIGGSFGNIGEIINSSAKILDYGNGESIFGEGPTSSYFARGDGSSTSSHFAFKNVVERLYGWNSSSDEVKRSALFGREHGTEATNMKPFNPAGYVGDYSITARANRGIAA